MERVKSGEEKTPMIKKLFFFQRLFKLVISQMWVWSYKPTDRSLSFLTLNSSFCNSESSDVTTAEYTASNTLLSTVPQYWAVSPSTLFFVGLPRACRVEECTHQTVVQWLFKQRLFCRAGFAKIGPHPQTLMWCGGVKRDQPPSHL